MVHDLRKRVKELAALHALGEVLQSASSPTPKLLASVAALLPAAWQYPEITAARLVVGELGVTTRNFVRTRWIQRARFVLGDGTPGVVEVAYLQPRPDEDEGPFLAEERSLIDSVAETLRIFLDHRRAEAERSFMASIVESSEDAIFVRTLEGVIITWNAGAERMFGYAAPEALGQSVAMLIPADRAEEVSQINAKTKRGERMEHYETVRLRKDGTQIYVSLTNSPMREARGRVSGVSTIARDITKRKRLELEILEINETLQRRVGQDLHDGLNQELRGIAYLSHALEQTLREQGLAEAQTATRITDLLQRAVAQARDLSRGLAPLRLEADGLMVALDELAAGTRSIYGVHCSFVCPQPVLVSNRSTAIHLYRIAREAVHNAVKHAGPKRIVIELSRPDACLKLTVMDDGKGLPANAVKTTGMGLKIMDYRASTIGGVLKLERAAEHGTVVSCVLPMAARHTVASAI